MFAVPIAVLVIGMHICVGKTARFGGSPGPCQSACWVNYGRPNVQPLSCKVTPPLVEPCGICLTRDEHVALNTPVFFSQALRLCLKMWLSENMLIKSLNMMINFDESLLGLSHAITMFRTQPYIRVFMRKIPCNAQNISPQNPHLKSLAFPHNGELPTIFSWLTSPPHF